MGRPERRDVDYFPFYAKDGRTLFILEDKYGCKGTGFFTNVLRFLALQTDHHFSIAEISDKLYFFSKTKCDEESGMDMLNIMASTGKIDMQLWKEHMVIASQDFLKSVEDAYRKRNNNIIGIDDIKAFYDGWSPEHKTADSSAGNPPDQSKSDNSSAAYQHKSKETKVKTYTSDSIEYRLANYLFSFILKRNQNFKKPDMQKWTKSIDLMIRMDNREPESIKEIIKWCQNDTADKQEDGTWKGWASNILSTVKLREKFDVLFLKMQEQNQQGKQSKMQPKTYAQAKDLEQRMLARSVLDELKDEETNNQNNKLANQDTQRQLS